MTPARWSTGAFAHRSGNCASDPIQATRLSSMTTAPARIDAEAMGTTQSAATTLFATGRTKAPGQRLLREKEHYEGRKQGDQSGRGLLL
jgi:hypothetical protein